MVLAFIIQTLDSHGPEIAYYRFYSSWLDGGGAAVPQVLEDNPESNQIENSCLFDSSIEKKDLLECITQKIHMLYSLKLKQSLIPFQNQDKKTIICKGCFLEKDWKNTKFSVFWEGVPGIGFSLVCDTNENVVHVQNVLGLIVSELEKHLQLLSYPSTVITSLDSVALILDTFLPGGSLLYLNSSLIKHFEKQLDTHLHS